MEVRIQSIHFDASEQLQAFIQKKAVKLEKYHVLWPAELKRQLLKKCNRYVLS